MRYCRIEVVNSVHTPGYVISSESTFVSKLSFNSRKEQKPQQMFKEAFLETFTFEPSNNRIQNRI